MKKNYNFEREKLRLPEYGRHIQHMVDYLVSIQDRSLRNDQARVVIEIMGNINPLLRDTADIKHKLWDHLFIMSDFKLDVDSPYPIPSSDILYPKPDKLNYPRRNIARKYYGKNIENILASLKKIKDPEIKTQIASNVARYMRAKSFEYNHEHPNNEIIIKDIREMSDNTIFLDENSMGYIKNDYKQPQNVNRPRKNFTQNPHPAGKTGTYAGKSNGKHRTGKHSYK